MGFLEKKSGFTPGAPLTVKANMSDGEFQLLGKVSIGKKITIGLLKEVDLPSTCLFPEDPKRDKPLYDWKNIFYFNLETNEVCSTLIKTYSHGQFEKLKREIMVYNNKNKTEFDASDFAIDMVVENEKRARSDYETRFYFCREKNGNPVRYLNEDGSVNDKAIPNKLEEDVFCRNKEFYLKHKNDLYDGRLGKEIFEMNYGDEALSKVQKMPPITQRMIYARVLSEAGYFDKSYLDKLVEGKNLPELA